jgi:hypothetical protein
MAADKHENGNNRAFPPRLPELEQRREINERRQNNLSCKIPEHGFSPLEQIRWTDWT